MNWNEMSPRERDALVATEVMGWDAWKSKHGHWVVTDPGGGRHKDGSGLPKYDPHTGERLEREWWDEVDPPFFTTDISAAWEVVGALHEAGLYVSISKPARALTWDVRGWNDETNDNRFIAHADTAPEAICLAALRAKGVEV